jgi:uncharacterized protein (TIGR03437 family)
VRAALSSDGSRLLVVETISGTSHAFWTERNLPGRNDLGLVRDGSATISGDGRIVWLVQSDGRLARVNLATGEREFMSNVLPSRTPLSASSARGSLFRLWGIGFDDGPWHLDAWEDSSDAVFPVTPIDTGSDHIDFQVPWALPSTWMWVGYSRPGDVFEQVVYLVVSESYPQFWSDPNVPLALPGPPDSRTFFAFLVKAVHQGWDRLVTPADPARAGEVVHVYMSGLGPVAPVQRDNTPAPNPPPSITSPFTCSFPNNVAAPVRFAGLAVGMVGVYQVELEIPRGPLSPIVTCTFAAPQFQIDAVGYLPLAP